MTQSLCIAETTEGKDDDDDDDDDVCWWELGGLGTDVSSLALQSVQPQPLSATSHSVALFATW